MYFRERSKNLVDIAEQNKITWFNGDKDYSELTKVLRGRACNEEVISRNIKTQLKLRKYPLAGGVISVAQLKVLHYLAQGYSSKVIAKTLNIADRTVQSHIANMKSELGLSATNQLLKAYHCSNLRGL